MIRELLKAEERGPSSPAISLACLAPLFLAGGEGCACMWVCVHTYACVCAHAHLCVQAARQGPALQRPWSTPSGPGGPGCASKGPREVGGMLDQC